MGSPPVKGFGQGDAALAAWAESVYRPEDGLLREIRERSAAAGLPAIQVGAFDGLHLEVLARAAGARRAEVARASFERTGFASRVRIHLGRAAEELRVVEAEGPFDLVFLDADKIGYPGYLAWAEDHLRVGGVLLADNTFGFGHVHEVRPEGESPEAMAALRAFSERLARGGRFRATMIPTAEGLSFGVKVR